MYVYIYNFLLSNRGTQNSNNLTRSKVAKGGRGESPHWAQWAVCVFGSSVIHIVTFIRTNLEYKEQMTGNNVCVILHIFNLVFMIYAVCWHVYVCIRVCLHVYGFGAYLKI